MTINDVEVALFLCWDLLHVWVLHGYLRLWILLLLHLFVPSGVLIPSLFWYQHYQHKTRNNLTTLINSYRERLTDKEYTHFTIYQGLNPVHSMASPKSTKAEKISKACKEPPDIIIKDPSPRDLKLRPIIAAPSCETNCLSISPYTLRRSFLKHIKGYKRDDLDILNHFTKTVNEKP